MPLASAPTAVPPTPSHVHFQRPSKIISTPLKNDGMFGMGTPRSHRRSLSLSPTQFTTILECEGMLDDHEAVPSKGQPPVHSKSIVKRSLQASNSASSAWVQEQLRTGQGLGTPAVSSRISLSEIPLVEDDMAELEEHPLAVQRKLSSSEGFARSINSKQASLEQRSGNQVQPIGHDSRGFLVRQESAPLKKMTGSTQTTNVNRKDLSKGRGGDRTLYSLFHKRTAPQ